MGIRSSSMTATGRGFQAVMSRYTDPKITVIILTNLALCRTERLGHTVAGLVERQTETLCGIDTRQPTADDRQLQKLSGRRRGPAVTRSVRSATPRGPSWCRRP